MKDRNLLTSKKRFTAGQCVPTHTAPRTTQFSEIVKKVHITFSHRILTKSLVSRFCCRVSSGDEAKRKEEEEEKIPFWDLRPRYLNGMNVRRSRTHTHIHLRQHVAERLLRDERINSKAGREKEESVLTLPVAVRRGGCSSLVSVNRSGGNFTPYYSHGHLPFALLSRPVNSTLVALPVIYETSPLALALIGTPENLRTFRRARGVHLDVRQFRAIDVYHYHEEHCFVPQLNVSGLSKRKSVGPVIAQEIPDENAP
ncbi:hypothetical protein ALC57_07097 [Trachymyrmex cornetzi]|uniref:Uncharacterized protein n=1 Tax=Trachymyrmex cornetzi TaxID=471704 RepID=A0A195E6W2_9HYME|nr:hypothetical protein ALC57_07097 [Trachymyrmex cornetzi]